MLRWQGVHRLLAGRAHWIFFDRELENGDVMVDRFLATEPNLSLGERTWLRDLKAIERAYSLTP